MSTFEVKIRTIDVLQDHPNAERLELVVIGGYKAVVQKGIHQVGDKILYIPEDTIFKNLDIADKLNIRNYLTGKDKNRVRAIRLRGILSQGIVLPAKNDDILDTVLAELGFGYYSFAEGIDFQEELQLEKYEEPIPITMRGKLRSWPTFIKTYDLENIKRPESMAALIDGEEVVCSEKLHGTNSAIAIGPGLNSLEDAFVCSRNCALLEDEQNVYWRAAREYNLIGKILEYQRDLIAQGIDVVSIVLFGEVVGVQDIKYGYTNRKVGYYAFDIMVNGEYLNYDDFVKTCNFYNISMVPLVYRGKYDYNTISNLAKGKTTLGTGEILEGVVVKPVVERYDIAAGRVVFKVISEDYLLRKGNTSELH